MSGGECGKFDSLTVVNIVSTRVNHGKILSTQAQRSTIVWWGGGSSNGQIKIAGI